MEEIIVPGEPRWPGLSGGRWTGIGLLAAVVAVLGWLAGSALRGTGAAAERYVLFGLAAFFGFLAFLWAQYLARAEGELYRPVFGWWAAFPAGAAVFAAGVLLGGAGGWPVGAGAVAAVLAAAGAARRDRRLRLAALAGVRAAALHRVRVRAEGETVRASVVEVLSRADTPDDRGRYWTGLTLRYTVAAGTEHTVEHRAGFSVHDTPRVGRGATVHHLSADPADIEVVLDPAGLPADDPDLPDRIARLHRLHLDGALTAEEFALAKRQLLAPGN
ncbi:SHOCT domain-containing protein [Kitasatospora sp. NPDC088391]|uniref:SHOCT domain-containing protein n=1 Tax=Kitasatospora sp. NPDC088391 TaxID=3364074 RepID=UPI00380AD32A